MNRFKLEGFDSEFRVVDHGDGGLSICLMYSQNGELTGSLSEFEFVAESTGELSDMVTAFAESLNKPKVILTADGFFVDTGKAVK